MYELALELQRALSGAEFTRTLASIGRSAGVSRFMRASNSVVFAVSSSTDDIDGGAYSALLKLHNPRSRTFPEFGSALERFAKVAWCMAEISKRGFPPVAEIYATGVMEFQGELIPWSLEQRLRGKEMKQVPNREVAAMLWEKTGMIAASILKIEPSGYGGRFDPASGKFTETWEGYLNNEIAAAGVSKLVDAGILSNDQAERLNRDFEDLRHLDKRYAAALSHRDLAPHNNIFFDEAHPERGSVVGVIDFEQAASVPGPVYEIAMTQWYETVFNEEIDLGSFLRGLGIGEKDYQGSQLETDCNSILLLRLCAHISFYLDARNAEWARPKDALPRMLKRLSLLS
jgi:aminoglycoside phosphotransferase (APT) family kinase protein